MKTFPVTALVFLVGAILSNKSIANSSDYDIGLEESIDDSFLLNELPEVLTVTKLKQSIADTPASVTVIDGALIENLGLSNIWEVFRLVPGMTLGFVESNVPVLSYHGTVANDQRRLQVLVDGRSTFKSGLADVDWHFMPVALDNIQRIEVTRGPNAAAYGSNSFLAIINIITKNPYDTSNLSVRTINGSEGLAYHYLAGTTHTENSDWRISAMNRQHNGFDYRYFNNPDGSSSETVLPFNDSYNVGVLNIDGVYRINNDNQFDLHFGYAAGEDEVDPQEYGPEYGIADEPNIHGQDFYGQLRWTHYINANHFLHIQSYYQRFLRKQVWTSVLDMQALGLSPDPIILTLNANQNVTESRFDIELQDTIRFSDRFRTVSGISYREDEFQSETYLNGKGSNYLFRLFTNAEYTPIKSFTLNAGGMFEDDTDNGEFISPRIAFNYHLTDYQTIRLIFSKAYRTPDTFEQSADWGYVARNVQPDALSFLEGQRIPGIGTVAPGGLKAEKIISREISYFGQFRFAKGVWTIQTKYFYDSLYDIISGRISLDRWDLENNVSLTQRGVELEASVDVGSTFARVTYAYIDQDGEYTGTNPIASNPLQRNRYIELESRLTAQHSGSFALIQQLPLDTQASLAYYVADSLNDWFFHRIDIRLAKKQLLPKASLTAAVVMQHYMNGDPILHRDNVIEDRNHFAIELSAKF